MSDQFGSSPTPTPKTLTCPTCGYLMEVKYQGDMLDKKAICPACNTKVDVDDSFSRTRKRITRKKGLFGSEEIEEIISEERSDFKPNQTPPPAANVFGQYTAKPGQPYPPTPKPIQPTPQVFVSGGAYTYTPGQAKSKSGGGGLGCIILFIVLASIIVPIGAGIYFSVIATKDATSAFDNVFGSNPDATEIAQTAEFMIRSQGKVPTAASQGGGDQSGAVALASWKIFNGHTSGLDQVAFSADGLHVATTSSDDTLRLWDISTGETIATITGTTFEEPRWVVFSPDGRYMIVASDSDGGVKFYDPQDGSLQFQVDTGSHNVNGLAVSPDSTQFAVSDYESIYLFDINSRSRLTQSPAPDAAESPYFQRIKFSTDGKLIFASTNNGIYVWDLTSKSLKLLLSAESSSYNDFAMVPGSNQLVVANSGSDGLQVIDLSNGRILRSMPGGLGGGADAIAVSPDGKWLASGSFFGDFFIYDLATYTVKFTTTEDLSGFESIDFSPNGHVVAIATSGKEVRLFLTGTDVDPFENVTVADPSGGAAVGFSSPTPAPVVGCVISSRNQVNLRNGPGTDYTQRGSINPGTTRQADGQATGTDGKKWWRLVDGTWVRSDVVEEDGDCTNLPTVTP